MEIHKVKILAVRFVTHDVKQFIVEKPENYRFKSGQYTEVAINNEKWKGEFRPFTFTSIPDDKVLEFNIKKYEDDNGVTKEIHNLKVDEEFIIKEPMGSIEYKGEGFFIAGGAGITPFISIFRYLAKKNKISENKLFFSNKTWEDIIWEKELRGYFGENSFFTLTRENKKGYLSGRIDNDFLEKQINGFKKYFYICGPTRMVGEITSTLIRIGVNPDYIVVET